MKWNGINGAAVVSYALFPCPGVNDLPSARVTGSKGEPLANTHLLLSEKGTVLKWQQVWVEVCVGKLDSSYRKGNERTKQDRKRGIMFEQEMKGWSAVVPVGPFVGLSGSAFSLGGWVTEREDEWVGVQRGHFLAHRFRKWSSLRAVKGKEYEDDEDEWGQVNDVMVVKKTMKRKNDVGKGNEEGE